MLDNLVFVWEYLLSGAMRVFVKQKLLLILTILSFVLNFLLWGILIYEFHGISDSIALHYNIYFGVDLIGSWWQVLVLPLFGLIFNVANSMLAVKYFIKVSLWSYFLVITNFLLQLGLLWGGLIIVWINI